MIEKEFKTRDVAYETDMDMENFRNYINGKQEMKESTLLTIANALNVEVGQLFKKTIKNSLFI